MRCLLSIFVKNEQGNEVYSIEAIVRGIQEQVIDTGLGKNCTEEQVVELLEYLTKDKIPMQ